MRAFLRAASAAMARRRAIVRAVVATCFAALAGTSSTTPSFFLTDSDPSGYWSGAAEPTCPVTYILPNYLSADQKMMVATGTWGRSVHLRGPNFFRYARDKRLEEERGSRRPAERSGFLGPEECIHRTALSYRCAV
jgi:hypothetical protein